MKVGFQKVPSNKLGWRWKISVQDSKMSLAWKAWGFEAGTLSWTDAQNWNPWHLLWCQAWINWIIKAHSWNRPEFGGFSICKRINGGTIWVWPKTSKSLEGKRTRNLNFVARPPFWGWTSGLPYSHLHKPQPSPPHDLRSAELLDCWEDEVGLIAAKCHGFEQPKFGDVANNDSAYDLIRAPCPGKKQINIHLSFWNSTTLLICGWCKTEAGKSVEHLRIRKTCPNSSQIPPVPFQDEPQTALLCEES